LSEGFVVSIHSLPWCNSATPAPTRVSATWWDKVENID
jgi:hypothetical protein